MTTNKVLKEALSISEFIHRFNKEDKNPYKKIQKIIADKEINK
tara:strand:+ start:635 stop:763 length:129 start_codon:yes stop_codon:yes gene_type:complete